MLEGVKEWRLDFQEPEYRPAPRPLVHCTLSLRYNTLVEAAPAGTPFLVPFSMDGKIMSITNDFFNRFNNYNKNTNKTDTGGVASDLFNKLKNKKAAQAEGADENGETQETGQTAGKEKTDKTAHKRNLMDSYEKAKSGAANPETETKELSAEEKRQAALKKIMAQLDAEEAQRYPRRHANTNANGSNNAANANNANAADKAATNASASSSVSSASFDEAREDGGIDQLLNDLPLFNEFKTSLMDAFRSMDSGTKGSITAQYEMNYSAMQYIAAEGGGYNYEETNFSIKLDLNYVKAAAGGGMTGAEMADKLGEAKDFESFVKVLQGFQQDSDKNAAANAAATGAEGAEGSAASEKSGAKKNEFLSAYLNKDGKPMSAKEIMNAAFKTNSTDAAAKDLLKSFEDYWSPEATAGRIVDFATAFFPNSESFKNGGDTEESRKEFAEKMRSAIQKGFDQAMGHLGTVPTGTQEGIDKTHELAMKGLDDFIKNGMEPEKEDTYEALNEFTMSFQMSYSHKSASASANNQATQSA